MRKILAICILFYFFGILSHAASERQVLRVGVIPGEPMSYYSNGVFGGISVDLWSEIANRIGVDYQFNYLSEDVDNGLKLLSENKLDVVIGAITPTYYRSKMVDLSQPYIRDPIGAAVSVQKNSNFMKTLMTDTGLKFLVLLAALILMYALYSLFLWYFEKDTSEQSPKKDMRSVFRTVLHKIIFNEKLDVPQSVGGQVIHFSWMKGYVILSSLAYAIFISFFTVSAIQSNLKDDIYGSPHTIFVGIEGNAPYRYAVQKGLHVIAVQNRDKAFKVLLSGEASALIDASIIAENYIIKNNLTDKLKMYEYPLQNSSFVMAMPYGSRWRIEIDRTVLFLREHGLISSICKKYITTQSAEKYCVE